MESQSVIDALCHSGSLCIKPALQLMTVSKSLYSLFKSQLDLISQNDEYMLWLTRLLCKREKIMFNDIQNAIIKIQNHENDAFSKEILNTVVNQPTYLQDIYISNVFSKHFKDTLQDGFYAKLKQFDNVIWMASRSMLDNVQEKPKYSKVCGFRFIVMFATHIIEEAFMAKVKIGDLRGAKHLRHVRFLNVMSNKCCEFKSGVLELDDSECIGFDRADICRDLDIGAKAIRTWTKYIGNLCLPHVYVASGHTYYRVGYNGKKDVV